MDIGGVVYRKFVSQTYENLGKSDLQKS